jgi:hypothetical protein
LPAIVSLAWFFKRVGRPRNDRRWVYVIGSGSVIVVFLIVTVYSQGGYLGSGTEERYFFYAIPAFWLGAFAAIEDREVRAVELLLVAVGLALVYASIPFLPLLTQETAFLVPVESIVPHVLARRFGEIGLTGLSTQDALAVLALLVGAVTAWLWRRRGPALRWALVVGAVVQLLFTGYAFAVIDGRIHSIAGRTGGSVGALGWVDAHSHGGEVAWLGNLPSSAPPTNSASPVADQARTTLFWNSSVRSWLRVPALGLAPVEPPMSALPGAEATVSPATGLLLADRSSVVTPRYVVGAADSPFLQLQGQQLARSPDGVLVLTRVAMPARASWLASGLLAEGGLPAGGLVRLSAFGGARASAPASLTAVLVFSPLPSPPPGTSGPTRALVSVRLGHAAARSSLRVAGEPVRIRLSTCVAPAAAVSGAIVATLPGVSAGAAVGSLESVSLASGGNCSSARRSLRRAR